MLTGSPQLATELVTPPLGSDSVILPGVTRDSILALARDHASGKLNLKGLPKKITVSERNLTSRVFSLSHLASYCAS